MILLFIFLWLLSSISLAFIFKKAGKNPILAFVPFLCEWILLEITGRPKHWIFGFILPIIGHVIAIGILVDLANCFGKTKFYQHVLAVSVGFLYFPYICMQKDTKYLGTIHDLPEKEKSTAREWADAILFAVAAATFIRWATFEAYTIPTPSMEKSLLVGDFLFVSKMHYGPRTPKTPLQIPLTHKYLPFTSDASGADGIQSYVDWIELPSLRLPGISEVKRNDVVVFNYPEEPVPTDVKTNYIKRCVAVAGDTLRIKHQQLFINGKAQDQPEDWQQSYKIFTTGNQRPSERMLLRWGATDGCYPSFDGDVAWIVNVTKEEAAQIEKAEFVKRVALNESIEPEPQVIPNSSIMKWNKDNMGPIWIPKAGETIAMTPLNIAFYEKVIRRFEDNENVEIKGKELWINGQKAENYTFKQDYYFMMGDNRHNSLDSRFWGFVPADHIVGKAMFIWLSLDQNESGFSKIRWNRMFDMIE